ncbi:MAG: cation:proton antiporter subunit C [Parvularculales bacterium]
MAVIEMSDTLITYIMAHYNYWMIIVLMMVGIYVIAAHGNLIKKIVGLTLFQTSMFLLYISVGKVSGGTVPILTDNGGEIYSNPLPHVLILTAIVVGISITALGLALVVRIREEYGTIEEDEILVIEHAMDAEEARDTTRW